MWYMWVLAHKRDLCLPWALCVPFCVLRPALAAGVTGCSSPVQSACLLPSWGQAAPNRFSMPVWPVRTHPGLDSVKRKQTICSRGAQLGISVSLQQSQTQPEHKRGELLICQTFFRAEESACNCQGSGNNNNAFSTNAV